MNGLFVVLWPHIKTVIFGSIFTRTFTQGRQLETNKQFYGTQIRAVIVEIREYNNKNTILKKFVQLNHYNSYMYRPLLVSLPHGVHINIGIKRNYK